MGRSVQHTLAHIHSEKSPPPTPRLDQVGGGARGGVAGGLCVRVPYLAGGILRPFPEQQLATVSVFGITSNTLVRS